MGRISPKGDVANIFLFGSYNRGWFYHKEHRFWFIRVSNMEPLVKTSSYERGSYLCFDPHTFETVRKVWSLSIFISFH